MPLNDVKFTKAPNGLGRLPAEEDYVSALVLPIAVPVPAWNGSAFKRYVSPAEARADGITTSSAAYAVLAYQIERFFAEAGSSELYVVNAAGLTADQFNAYTEGRVRQIFYDKGVAFAGLSAAVGELQTFANRLAELHAPVSIITSVTDVTSVTGGADQPDVRAMASDRVSVLICGSGSGKAADVIASTGLAYLPEGGAVLGALARAAVHESIAWVERFNFRKGADLEKIRFSDGADFTAKTAAELDALNAKGYLFFRKHTGIAGSYVNDSHAATSATDDYAFLENGRVIDKAQRRIRISLLPDLSRPLQVDRDGKLDAATIGYLEAKASRPLDLMAAAGEISAYEVTIDPAQDVLATSKVNIQGSIIPRGVARNFEFNLGYTVALQSA